MKYLIALILITAVTATAAPLCLYSPAVADTVSGDTVQPALAHSVLLDTLTAADTVGYSILSYLTGRRWPDSARVKMHGIGEDMRWTELSPFTADSVEGVDGFRRVWWSGSTVLEDSVIVPGSHKVSGDSLVPSI